MANCRVHLSIQPRQRVGLSVHSEAGASLSLGGLLYDRAADVWGGPYIVIPGVDEQTMATQGFRMAHDFSVTAIPYLTTTNAAGGMTATIAS